MLADFENYRKHVTVENMWHHDIETQNDVRSVAEESYIIQSTRAFLWSDCMHEALLIIHTTLLEISCRGSFVMVKFISY